MDNRNLENPEGAIHLAENLNKEALIYLYNHFPHLYNCIEE